MSNPVLNQFLQILGKVAKDQVIKISATNGVLPGDSNCFENLGVISVNRKKHQYLGDEYSTDGIEIIGPDYDHPDKKIFRVFCPCPTALTISYIETGEEISFGEAISGLFEGMQSIIEEIAEEVSKSNMSEEELKTFKENELADQEKIQEYILDSPIRCMIPPSTFHQFDGMNCLNKALSKKVGFLSPDDQITSVCYRAHDGEHNYYDMLITEVYNFAQGFIIGFIDVEPKNKTRKRKLLQVLQGETVSLDKYERHYFFIRDLKNVVARSVKDYALKCFLPENNPCIIIPPQKKSSILIGENHVANVEKLERAIATTPDLLTSGDKVVNIKYDGNVEKSILITKILKSGNTTIISCKDLKKYGDKNKRMKSLLEFLIQGEVAVPPKEKHICCFNVEEVALCDPYDYAADILTDKKVENIRKHRTIFEEVDPVKPDFELIDFDHLLSKLYLEDTTSVYVIKLGDTVLHDIVVVGLEVIGDDYLICYRELKYEGVSDEAFALMMVTGKKIPVPDGPTKRFVKSDVTEIIRRNLKDYGVAKFLDETD